MNIHVPGKKIRAQNSLKGVKLTFSWIEILLNLCMNGHISNYIRIKK